MSADDWYRNKQWTNEAAEHFEAKLKRARRKAQYLRIQASCLAAIEPEVALELLNRYFQLDDDFDHAQAFVDRATAFLSLGRTDDAVSAYEDALQREADFPNLKTQACLELPFLIATTPLPDMFDRALAVLEQSADSLTFPVDVFRWNASYALILSACGRSSEATTYADAASIAASKTESGFRYHQNLGLVENRYPDLLRELELIASSG